jgi:predicted dehydrogenase
MTPDYCHEQHAVGALSSGKAVYLEKPMHITVAGCDHILETAMKTGSKLFVGHNMRYFPYILKMKEIINSGVIGDIQACWCRHFINYGGDAYFCDWHSERKNITGLLLQKGSHDIDVIHWLMGGYTKSVVGMGMLSVYNHGQRRKTPGRSRPWSNENWPPLETSGFSANIDVEDHNMILMQLDNGTQASYTQCHYTPDSERNYTFIGTKGRIENIGIVGEGEIHVWTRRGPRKTPDIIYHMKEVPGGHGGSDPAIIQDFLGFVQNNTKPAVSPVAARNAVATGQLGHYSMRHGNNRCDIPPLSEKIVAYFENGQKYKGK